jgi:ribosomal protein S18 acetylase RimI-like enzyme
MRLLTENLNATHRKNAFECGKSMLDTYIQRQANQDIRRKLSACFVVVDEDKITIKGYYTLSNNSIPLEEVPESFKKKLPKSYASIPVTLLGRLAVDRRYQKQGIGELLLIDALKRSHIASESIGSFAIIVDPLDKEAQKFYKKYGFIDLPDSGKMFLPMKTVNQLFADK